MVGNELAASANIKPRFWNLPVPVSIPWLSPRGRQSSKLISHRPVSSQWGILSHSREGNVMLKAFRPNTPASLNHMRSDAGGIAGKHPRQGLDDAHTVLCVTMTTARASFSSQAHLASHGLLVHVCRQKSKGSEGDKSLTSKVTSPGHHRAREDEDMEC